jgi:hypothetical protein
LLKGSFGFGVVVSSAREETESMKQQWNSAAISDAVGKIKLITFNF